MHQRHFCVSSVSRETASKTASLIVFPEALLAAAVARVHAFAGSKSRIGCDQTNMASVSARLFYWRSERISPRLVRIAHLLCVAIFPRKVPSCPKGKRNVQGDKTEPRRNSRPNHRGRQIARRKKYQKLLQEPPSRLAKRSPRGPGPRWQQIVDGIGTESNSAVNLVARVAGQFRYLRAFRIAHRPAKSIAFRWPNLSLPAKRDAPFSEVTNQYCPLEEERAKAIQIFLPLCRTDMAHGSAQPPPAW
jgi:hypothetical protein